MSISFGDGKKKETAVEASRRERLERTKKKVEEVSWKKIVRCYRRHRTLALSMEVLRAEYDESMDKVLGGAEGLKALRLAPGKLVLPPNRVLYNLLLRLLFFYNRKSPTPPTDNTRLIDLSRLITASIAHPTAALNFAFLTCDTKLTPPWHHTARSLITTAATTLSTLTSSPTLPRIDFGVLSKLLIDLTMAKQWAYIRIEGVSPQSYTPQQQAIITQLTQKASSLCTSLLGYLASETCMFEVAQSFLTRHIKPSPSQDDVLAIACMRLSLAMSVTSAASLLHFARTAMSVPYLPLRIPRQLLSSFVNSNPLWEAILKVVYSSSKKSEEWPQRYLLCNFVEIGHMCLKSPTLAARTPQWIEAVRHLLGLLPSWLHVKRILEAEPLVERQIRVLWSPDTVSILFADLLDEGTPPTDLAAAVQSRSEKGAKPKGFFARLREKARGKEKETVVNVPLVYNALQVDAAIAAWAPPSWMLSAQLFTFLVVKWSSRVILAAMAARSFLLVALWTYLQRNEVLLDIFVEGKKQLPQQLTTQLGSILLLFLYCYDHFLPVCDDNEFYTLQQPFSLKVVSEIVSLLARLAFRLTWQQAPTTGPGVDKDYAALMNSLKTSCKSVLLLLNDRNVRREFCPKEVWMIATYRKGLGFHFDPKTETTWAPGVKAVVQDMPFLISFADRALYLRKLIEKDREENSMGEVKYGLTIRRDYLLEDGLAQVSKLVGGTGGRAKLKARFHVQFKNSQGLEEAGIDAGGVFKEFIEALSKKGFDPGLALFKTTEDNKLYPNAESRRLYSQKELKELYEFMGRIVAKAVYEGVVLNLPMAEFFLNTMLGRSNFVEDLRAMDPAFHRNLVALKEIDDVEDLCLTFCFEEEKFGKTVSTNLIPNGSEIVVTNDNLIQYIAMMAHVKLNLQYKEQASAFISGFHDMLPPKWIGLFNRNELQQLISGSSASYDVTQLRQHTKYAGGYSDSSSVIKTFWKTLEDFNDEQKAAFLAFVTSSSKPPLLGFGHLNPPFCIRCVNDDPQSFFGGIDRLPSASTCFNLLKLPPYKSRKDLKEKLLYAVTSGAGFELS